MNAPAAQMLEFTHQVCIGHGQFPAISRGIQGAQGPYSILAFGTEYHADIRPGLLMYPGKSAATVEIVKRDEVSWGASDYNNSDEFPTQAPAMLC